MREEHVRLELKRMGFGQKDVELNTKHVRRTHDYAITVYLSTKRSVGTRFVRGYWTFQGDTWRHAMRRLREGLQPYTRGATP